MADATLKQLRSLAAVHRHGTVVDAARSLHVTAPAVGQQLKLLERSVGAELTTRTPQGLVLTEVGHEIVATAERIEAELESCWEAVRMLTTGMVGTVRLGAVSTAKYFAPMMLAGFWRAHPDVEVTLRVGNRRETISAMEQHDIDIAIMGRPPAELELDTQPIGPHPHVIIAPPHHDLAGRRSIPIDEVCDEVFLVREVGSGTRILTEWLFTTAGRQPRLGMEIYSNETIKQAVIAELGVALISAHTVAAELVDGRLVALDVVGTPIMRSWRAIRRSAGHLSAAGESLWEFLGRDAGAYLPALP